MDALVVIDMDHGDCWTDDILKLSDDQIPVAIAILRELAAWHARSGLVIFVTLTWWEGIPQNTQITDDDSGCIICNKRENWGLASFLRHRHEADYEPAFVKHKCDVCMNRNFVDFLRTRGVTRIFLVGCVRHACIIDSALGIARLGIDVMLLDKCVYPPFFGERDRDQFTAHFWGLPGKLQII